MLFITRKFSVHERSCNDSTDHIRKKSTDRAYSSRAFEAPKSFNDGVVYKLTCVPIESGFECLTVVQIQYRGYNPEIVWCEF